MTKFDREDLVTQAGKVASGAELQEYLVHLSEFEEEGHWAGSGSWTKSPPIVKCY